ncbi:hypothetical protein E2C01_028799 [Portunus trituberculatus]|uniref:Uncharacterized protein n=1 Tax=Portunus trituberculatus TaxID=210409 RepID=A0A5B7EQ09_PORTR|nr:hypothetical protein [Portunus trituberculatus]
MFGGVGGYEVGMREEGDRDRTAKQEAPPHPPIPPAEGEEEEEEEEEEVAFSVRVVMGVTVIL